jgi:hypothetical protein
MGPVSAPSSTVMNGTLWTIRLLMKLTSRDSRSSLATMTGPLTRANRLARRYARLLSRLSGMDSVEQAGRRRQTIRFSQPNDCDGECDNWRLSV